MLISKDLEEEVTPEIGQETKAVKVRPVVIQFKKLVIKRDEDRAFRAIVISLRKCSPEMTFLLFLDKKNFQIHRGEFPFG